MYLCSLSLGFLRFSLDQTFALTFSLLISLLLPENDNKKPIDPWQIHISVKNSLEF